MVEVETLGDNVVEVQSMALDDAMANRLGEVEVATLGQTLA